jgi:hypothetical protein
MHLEEVAALSGAAAAGAGAGGSGGACRVQLQWLYEEAVDSFGVPRADLWHRYMQFVERARGDHKVGHARAQRSLTHGARQVRSG